MPALHVKNGGNWVLVDDGNLAVKYNGAWIFPSHLHVKNNGAWVDSGYDGFPAPPTGFAINASNFSTLSVKWTPGVGGAPVGNYEIALNSADNSTRIATLNDTASPSGNFSVQEDTKYQIWIRAETQATGGVTSAWVGPIKWAIGHAAYTTYTDDPATRPYTLAKAVTGYRDVAVGPTIPTSVVVQTIRYQISNTFSGILSPYGSHSISRWQNAAEKEQFSWLSASIDTTLNVTDYTSNGGVQGMVCRGTGWSSTPSGSFICTGTITVNGIENYTAHNAHSHPAVANAAW